MERRSSRRCIPNKEQYRDLPRLSLAMTVAEFTAYLLDVYSQFWKKVSQAIIVSAKEFTELIERHPENIDFIGSCEVPIFLYDVEDDGMAHVVFTTDDAKVMLASFQSEAEMAANQYMTSWNRLKEGTLLVKLVNKSQNEIDTV